MGDRGISPVGGPHPAVPSSPAPAQGQSSDGSPETGRKAPCPGSRPCRGTPEPVVGSRFERPVASWPMDQMTGVEPVTFRLAF